MRWAAAAATCATLVAAGCGDDGAPVRPPVVQACTEIGCRPGVTFLLEDVPERATRVVACVAGRCRTVAGGGQPPGVGFVPVRATGGEREVVATLRIARRGARRPIISRTDVRLRFEYPNGRECPPACLAGTVRYDRVARRLVAAPTA